MKKVILGLGLVFCAYGYAFDGVAVKGDLKSVNLRDKPSVQKGKVVDKMWAGQTYASKETDAQKDEKGRTWYKVKNGWVASWVVSPVTRISNRDQGSTYESQATNSDDFDSMGSDDSALGSGDDSDDTPSSSEDDGTADSSTDSGDAVFDSDDSSGDEDPESEL